MVLPVFWDLAAVLVAKEIDAFGPDLVLMNGVAGWRQDLWFELGAVNAAQSSGDGSNILQPVDDGGPLVSEASETDYARPNLMSWRRIYAAASDRIAELADLEHNGLRFGDVLTGVTRKSYPRLTNTYLCNNTTYTVGYLMDHPGEPIALMEASAPRDDVDGAFDIGLTRDMSDVPRMFMHWPSDLDAEHIQGGADVLRAVIAAQLGASRDGEAPTRGDNDIADDR
jgi:hypothetical protein